MQDGMNAKKFRLIMGIKKRLVAALLTMGLCHSLYGMDEPTNNVFYTNEILVLIFEWLEPTDISEAFCCCSNWNKPDKQKIWQILFSKKFPKKHQLLLKEMVHHNWGQIFHEHHRNYYLANDIINMKNLPDEKVEGLISEPSTETKLINNLEVAIIEGIADLNINETKDVFSVFLVHWMINFYAIMDMPLATEYQSPNSITGPRVLKAILASANLIEEGSSESSEEEHFDVAIDVIDDLLDDFENLLISELLEQPGFKKAFKCAKKNLKESLLEANIYSRKINGDMKKLGLFYILCLVAQREFIDNHFKTSCQSLLEPRIYKQSLTISIRELLEKISKQTWSNHRYQDNPYFKSIRNILYAISPQC